MTKKWKYPGFILFITFCIMLNYFGRQFSTYFQLPVWLDSFGTVLCAYIAGPVCGAIVGMTGNLIYAMITPVSAVYSLVSITLGIIVGVAAKKRALESMFGIMTVSAVSAVASMMLAVPLNIIFYQGKTGNMWGNGVLGILHEWGAPEWLSVTVGEFYVNFLDKLLTLFLLVGVLRLIKLIKKKRAAESVSDAAKTLSILLVLLLCLAPASVSAQEESHKLKYDDYVQTVYSSSNGLPCGEANDIAQTNDGILWIGTYAGLYRYNGREFRRMEYDSVRNVNCLYVDEEGRLWIGSNDNGLSIMINDKIVNVVSPVNGLPSYSVRNIIQGTDGLYYIGTTSSMQVLSLNGGLKKVNTLWEINYTDEIAADQKGHVAAVTDDGRLFLLQNGYIVSSLRITNNQEVFKSCCFDPQGHLLAGTTSNHIYTYDVSSGGFEEIGVMECEKISSIKDLCYLDNGDMIICADNGVGFLDTNKAFQYINTNDFNNSIDNFQIDYQGNLWFTSSRLGLLRMAPSAFMDVYGAAGLPHRVVNTVVRWQGNYWFGTDKGLDVVDGDCNYSIQNDLTEKLEGVRIRCMLVDDQDHLWICTYGQGLMEVEPDGAVYVYDHNNTGAGNRVRLVKQLSDGTILAGSNTGLCFIKDHEVQQLIGVAEGLSNPIVLTVAEMPDGKILVGTDGAGIAVLEDRQVTRMFKRADGLSSEVILRIVHDKKDEGVFIVTSNSLCFMSKDGQIRNLDNFPYYNNYDVWARDEDTLFVMGSAGIYVVNRDELLSGKKPLPYDLLDSRRGLSSALTANSWNYSDEQGNLFLPCDSGVFMIYTRHYTSSTRSYRMMVSSVRLDDDFYRLDNNSPIRVGRSVSKIELNPEIVNYTIQDPNVGFFMEGVDKDWIVMPQSSLTSIVYTNLPTGTFHFHIAVLDTDKTSIISERTYTLVKEKEIYDYPWFIVYLLIVPMIAVAWFTWFIVRTRMQRTLEKQKRELDLAKRQIQMGNETIFAIAKAVDAKDERTSQHSLRVSQYSVMIGKAMGLSEEECEALRKTALMHDIGKIGIPDSILNKPARLTDEEYAVMKTHTTRGAEILKDFTLIDHVVEGAKYHHERYDGKGYPSGLAGDQIPLFGRIIGVADAFDAMTANRVYRKQLDFDYVLNEMRRCKGSQFDPEIVDILLRLINEGKFNLKEMYKTQEVG